jgi:hypothetical protein
VGSLALLFGPGVVEHARFAADRWHFNDDARAQIPPLLRYADPRLFRGDYIADYYLAGLPRGYWLVHRIAAPWVDPRTVALAIPYAALLVLVWALAATAWTLAGPPAAWAAAALCLSTDVYMQRLAGGLPRSLGFPLAGLALLALVRARPWALCALTILGAAFYYPVALLVGIVLALHLLVAPAAWGGCRRPWPFSRRCALLGVTAAVSALLLLPVVVAMVPFGLPLTHADVARYPEAGPGGRFTSLNLPVRGHVLEQTLGYAVRPLVSHGPAWHAGLRELGRSRGAQLVLPAAAAGVIATGYALLLASSEAARRLLLLVGGALVAHEVAFAAWPSAAAPERYLAHGFLLLGPVLLPASLTALAVRLWGRRPTATAVVVVGVVGVLLLLSGGRGPGHAGLSQPVPVGQRPLHEFLAQLPPSALIAGWPDDVLDNVPYLTGRRILVGFEPHLTFHRGYASEMRRRMLALIDAYFASDVGPLRRLRCDFGVTHLLVNREHYAGSWPTYFRPFDRVVAEAALGLATTPATLRQAARAAVFEGGPFLVLDLARLDDATANDGATLPRAPRG